MIFPPAIHVAAGTPVAYTSSMSARTGAHASSVHASFAGTPIGASASEYEWPAYQGSFAATRTCAVPRKIAIDAGSNNVTPPGWLATRPTANPALLLDELCPNAPSQSCHVACHPRDIRVT